MIYRITDSAALNAILTAYKANDWQVAYERVFDALSDGFDNPKIGVDKASWIWVNGARKVNGNDGTFAQYIRDYTARQYELRKGAQATDIDDRVQRASNEIAKAFVGDLLDIKPGAVLGLNAGIMPTLNEIGGYDAAGAASQVFTNVSSIGAPNYSPWAGTVLFTNLGDNSFFDKWILKLGSVPGFKVETGTYDLISAAQITTELKTVKAAMKLGLSDLWTLYELWKLGDAATSDIMTKTQAFLKLAYGSDIGTINIAASIYSQTASLSQSAKTYKVGTVFNDSGTKAITVEKENVIVHAGAGNDTINVPAVAVNGGNGGLRIIDAGEGTDTISYATVGAALFVTFEALGSLGGRATIYKGSASSVSPRDICVGFETLTLSEKADTITNLPDIAPKTSLKLNAGSGDDQVTLQKLYANVTIDGGVGTGDSLSAANMTTPVTFDVAAGKVTSGTTSMTYSNFEKFEGTNLNDTFFATNKTTSINGRGGVDTVDFSKLTAAAGTVLMPSVENIIGSKYADKFIGGAVGSTLSGGGGNDSLDGGGGNDTIYGGIGMDTLIGGEGNDLLYGDAGFNFLYGGNGHDTINNGVQGANIYDGAGDDVINSIVDEANVFLYEYPTDEIYLGTGSDTINIDMPNTLPDRYENAWYAFIRMEAHDGGDKLSFDGIQIAGNIPRSVPHLYGAWYAKYQGHDLWVGDISDSYNDGHTHFTIRFADLSWGIKIFDFQSGDFGIYVT